VVEVDGVGGFGGCFVLVAQVLLDFGEELIGEIQEHWDGALL
jgi:hypothetical protein